MRDVNALLHSEKRISVMNEVYLNHNKSSAPYNDGILSSTNIIPLLGIFICECNKVLNRTTILNPQMNRATYTKSKNEPDESIYATFSRHKTGVIHK